MAFDVALDTSLQRIYLDFDKALQLFKDTDLFHAAPLFIGKYEEAISYNNRFESTIPKRLGLPTIPGNLAEGIVVKSFQEIKEDNSERAIIKIKIEEFSEDCRFHQAVPHQPVN